MNDSLAIVPFDPRLASRIEAWASQTAVRALLKLPEVNLPVSQNSGLMAWVALRNDEPIALATVSLNDQHIAYLEVLVKPSERRQGVGGQIVEYILEQPAVKELTRLHALVEQDNVAAQKILNQAGFSRIGYSAEDGRLEFAKH